MEGKFRSEQQKNGLSRGEDWGGSADQQRWEDEEVDPEDSLAAPGPGREGKQRLPNNGSCEREKEEEGGPDCSTPSSWDNSGPPSDKLEVVEDLKNAVKQDNTNHLETLAGNLVASLVDEDEPLPDLSSKEPPLVKPEQPPVVPSPPQAQPGHSWSYLDPQGQVQGPFQSEEMLEWYSAGYFLPDLMLRRSCDQRFVSLTELMKLYSRVPFTPGPSPPPLTDGQEEERLKQQQLQQQMIQQQLMMQQQMMAQQQQQQHHHHQQQQQQQQQHHLHHHQQQQQQHHQQHPQHQQQQQHQMMGLPPSQHHNSEMSKLFGGGPGQHQGLGSLGLADMSRGFPDPRLNMLAPALSEPGPDPLKQLLARSQAGAAMPGLGRSHPASHPQAESRETMSSMFGMSRGPPPPPASVPEPHINIPFSQPPANNHNQPQANFDPIQSLLAQLHGTSSQPPSPQQSIWDLPPDQDNNKQLADKPLTSIWNEPPASSAHHHQPESPLELVANKETHEPTENIEELEHSESNSQELEADFSETDPTTFVKPKANEKKDKKSKKAEEKRKAKEKKAAEAAGSGPYIPGMSGAVRPEEQIVAVGNIMDLKEEEKYREQQDASRRQREQMEALVKLQEDQRIKLEREEQIRLQQEKLAKLAPWAKKDSSPVKEPGQGLTLQEIQKLEAEREKRERQQREVQEARLREEQRRLEEDERAKRAAKTINWATAATPTGGKVKSLAEIQAEEARVERERMEREMAGRTVRAKEGANNSGSGIWGGSGKSGTTWAGKIAANTPPGPAPGGRSNGNPWAAANGSPSSAAVVAPAGFWDPVLPDTPQQTKKMSGNNVNNNNNRNNKNQKKRGEEEHRGKQQQKSKNEFEEWCSKALQDLQAQVDIPTFLGFLMDIESPYEVRT